MSKADELARLQQQRASGALSESAFEAQASAVLKRGNGLPWAIVAILLLVVIGLSAKLVLRPAPPVQPIASAATNGAEPLAAGEPARPAAPDATARIFMPDMLGAQLSYLEAITGPAWRVDGDVRTYKVAGCTVDATTRRGQVFGLGMIVGPSCSFATKPFFANEDMPAANAMTFADAVRQFPAGKWSADCLGNCGNAADPVMRFTSNSYHADNWTVLRIERTIRDDGRTGAFLAVEKSVSPADPMQAETRALNCTRAHDAAAAQAFAGLRPDHVAVYAGDLPDACAS